jgi:uncharacterized caspase-like protein
MRVGLSKLKVVFLTILVSSLAVQFSVPFSVSSALPNSSNSLKASPTLSAKSTQSKSPPSKSTQAKSTSRPLAAPSETTSASASVNRPVKDKWALVIGISKYAKPELNLKYSDQDARDFYDYLVNEAHFAKDHVKLMLNEQATQKAILSEMGSKWLPRMVAPDDLLLVFISSHGSSSQMDIQGSNYIVAHDTDPDDLFATGIEMQQLVQVIKARVRSDRVVLVLDACHSGAAKASSKGLARQANYDAAVIAQGTGQLVIASSLPTQASWEYKERPNSVFTRSLIEGLRSNGNATTLAEAFSYLKQKVEDTVLRERGALQTPVLKSVWEGKDLLVAAPPASPRAVPALVASEPMAKAKVDEETKTSADQVSNSDDKAKGDDQSLLVAVNPPDKKSDLFSDLEPDAINLRVLEEDKPTPTAATTRSTVKRPPLPDRVAVLGFTSPSYLNLRHSADYMNDPVVHLQYMVQNKLQAAIGRRLLNPFESGAALGSVELSSSGMESQENMMSLGRALKARYVVNVSIEEAKFDKFGRCYFATIVRVFSGESGELLLVEGKKADCKPFQGKAAEQSTYLLTEVLPGSAEQIADAILSVVRPQ